jgi:CspA family cold shock protein
MIDSIIMSSNNDVTPSTTSEHLLGRVKWFNNKAGYGFVTVTDGSRSGTDVFVHHSSINVENQQYKYLVQGEYVEFDLVKVDSDKYEWQAYRVSGIKGGKLMCETRHELKIARNEYKTNQSGRDVDEPKMPRQKAAEPRQGATERTSVVSRVRGGGPREGDKKEWTLVGGKNQSRNAPDSTRSKKDSKFANVQSK